MLGDDPDPSVMTIRVGFGTVSDARAGGRGLTREVRLGLAVGSGLCRWSRAERREEREARRLFPETEDVRRLTDYIVAIVNRWGVKRTPNAMKLDRRSIYTKIRPHANSHPIPRTFSGHL